MARYLVEDGDGVDGRRRIGNDGIDGVEVVESDGLADADQRLVERNVQPTVDGRFEPRVEGAQFEFKIHISRHCRHIR